MHIGMLWAGRIFGTNTGNVFVRFKRIDNSISGRLRINERDTDVVQYDVSGAIEDGVIKLSGFPITSPDGLRLGNLTAILQLNSRGDLEGEWETDTGTAGTVILHPHDGPSQDVRQTDDPNQLHTASYRFGAIQIDKEGIVSIAEALQADFRSGRVVITVLADSAQARFLTDFKRLVFSFDRANWIKIFVQQPDLGGLNRVVSVEFGQSFNEVLVQGTSEAWVLGKLERLKRDIKQYEKNYATNIKQFGVSINQILLLAAIVYLPSLATLSLRAQFMVGIIILIMFINYLHSKFLPFSAIYLSKRSAGRFSRVAPTFFSWLIAMSAGVFATLIAGYLEGWLGLPVSYPASD